MDLARPFSLTNNLGAQRGRRYKMVPLSCSQHKMAFRDAITACQVIGSETPMLEHWSSLGLSCGRSAEQRGRGPGAGSSYDTSTEPLPALRV